MSLDNLKAKMKEKFKERFVVDLNEVFKQALPESEGWEHGTNAKPFIKQMTDAEEVEHFISEQVEGAYHKGYEQGVRDEVECIKISPEHGDQVYQEAFKAGQREMIEKMLTEIKDHEIRADNGGDYISEDTELMREELFQCVLEIKSQLKSELAEGEE